MANEQVTKDEMYRYVGARNDALEPIGTIKAWHKAGLGGIVAPALASNWVECNNQTLNDSESIWDGETLPDLNGSAARFLRGSATSGTEQAEDFLSHTHTLRGQASTGNASVLSGSSKVIAEHTNAFRGSDADTNMRGTSITSTGGSETRPINMSVVWIMRVK